MTWRTLARYVQSLEDSGELIRVADPVDVELEAGCFADRLVKRGGGAILFEQPRLPDGSISDLPLAMNLFGTRDRTNHALGVKRPDEIGNRMVSLMKPDIGGIMKAPWTGIGLALEGMSMAPMKVRKGACQQIVIKDPDVTKTPDPQDMARGWRQVHHSALGRDS